MVEDQLSAPSTFNCKTFDPDGAYWTVGVCSSFIRPVPQWRKYIETLEEKNMMESAYQIQEIVCLQPIQQI